MACPSCTLARTVARHTQYPSIVSKRALSLNFAPTTAPPAAVTTTRDEPESQRALLHISKQHLTHSSLHGPCNPNATPRTTSHSNITSRLGIRASRPLIGTQEWQTSTYHYNKSTTKLLPVASQTTDKLLFAYAALQAKGENPSTRSQVQGRRKSAEKVYVSGSRVKDFGDRVVVEAFTYDEAGRQEDEERKKLERKKRRQTGGGDGGRGRRGPPGGGGGGSGAR